jgi:hypothetical protein
MSPMMPLPRCRRGDARKFVSWVTACQTAADLQVGFAVVCCQSSTWGGLATAGQPGTTRPDPHVRGQERTWVIHVCYRMTRSLVRMFPPIPRPRSHRPVVIR